MEKTRKIVLYLRYWPFAICAIFYIYLIGHVFTGRQGLLRWMDYRNDISRLETRLAILKSEREAYEVQAQLISSQSIDLDILDIKAREKLVVSYPNEVTIWLDETR